MADVGPLIKFPDYAPDVTPLGQADSQTIFNVVPRADGYGPIPSVQLLTQSLPAPCRGYFFGRKTDGTIAVFAGTSTDLYLLNNTTFAWSLASQGSTSYTQLSTTDNWQFAQFNDLVIAVQANCAPQKIVLSTLATVPNFVNLGGSPPFAASIAIIGFFVVLTGLTSNARRAQWSDLDAPESWSAGVGLSDFQDFPDGGSCLICTGGDAYGMIFQEQSIRSMTYAAGNPAIFQFYRMSTQEALFAKYSVINIGNRVMFCGAGGFKMMLGSQAEPQFIGKERVDRTFMADVDRANLQLCIGSSDPTSTRVYWAYKSISGQLGAFDRILIYDFVLDKWTRLNMYGEYIATLAKPGATLEGLDAVALQQLQVTNATASPVSPLIRLTLSNTSNAYFTIIGQNFIEVQGVTGTTEANGQWHFNVISTGPGGQIDLIGSTFVHAYTGGGAIGGSLETLTFSLDAVARAAITSISIMDMDNTLGFFAGPNLEALLETGDADNEGRFIFTNAIMPITDASQVMVSIGWRNSPQAIPNYTAEQAIDDQGQAYINIESRYQRAHVRIIAGSSWTFVRGVQADSQAAGER